MLEVRFGTRKGIAREVWMEEQECGKAAALLLLRSASSQGVGGALEQVPSMIWNDGIFLMNVKGGGNTNTISFRWCGAHCDGCGF